MTSKNGSNKFFPLDEEPFGKSWGDWSAEWWKWLLSITDRNNPVNDVTGELQQIAQHYLPNVFFLAGTHVTKGERECEIPAGTAIFVPIATMSASYAEFPDLQREEDLRSYAEEGNQVRDMKLTIDGEEIDKESLEKYRVKSPLFKATLPEDNICLYVKGGETETVSDGYWAFLKPLPSGRHTLVISQNTKNHPPSGTLNCKYDLTYHLTVQ
jgi:hypothetical protein